MRKSDKSLLFENYNSCALRLEISFTNNLKGMSFLTAKLVQLCTWHSTTLEFLVPCNMEDQIEVLH